MNKLNRKKLGKILAMVGVGFGYALGVVGGFFYGYGCCESDMAKKEDN